MWHEGDVYRAQRGQSRGAAAGLGAQDMLVSGKTAIAEPSLADVAGPYRTAGGAMTGLSVGVQSAYGSQRSARAGERDGREWEVVTERPVEVLASPPLSLETSSPYTATHWISLSVLLAFYPWLR